MTTFRARPDTTKRLKDPKETPDAHSAGASVVPCDQTSVPSVGLKRALETADTSTSECKRRKSEASCMPGTGSVCLSRSEEPLEGR
ncbi:hypothetical protein JB92DRAFT_2899683 [Gautieria morchelliformis]|nr:hypothetical protein JB92DRAFT_2899683 [Gautieria morchelliformis]